MADYMSGSPVLCWTSRHIYFATLSSLLSLFDTIPVALLPALCLSLECSVPIAQVPSNTAPSSIINLLAFSSPNSTDFDSKTNFSVILTLPLIFPPTIAFLASTSPPVSHRGMCSGGGRDLITQIALRAGGASRERRLSCLTLKAIAVKRSRAEH